MTADSLSERHRRALLIISLSSVLVLLTDQLVKFWVVNNLPEGEPVPVIGEFLQWLFVRNSGAAFSIASGSTWIFTILAASVGIAIIWMSRRITSALWALFLGLLLGGTLGNLTDRLFREPGFAVGHVIDFISTPWMIPAIYNLADIAIVSSMVILIWLVIRGIGFDGTVQNKRVRAGEELAQ